MADDQQRQSGNGDRMDRFERGLEHLLETQASHEAWAAARFEETERSRKEFRADLAQLLTAQVLLTDAQRKSDEKIASLAESQHSIEQSQRKFDESMAALAESQREAGVKLNALIKVVDDLIRKRPPEASTS